MTTEAKVWALETCTGDEWTAFIAAMHSGEPVEIDEDMWYRWLEVLPPVYMGRGVTLPSGRQVMARFGFAEGEEPITAFWRENGRMFCCRTNEINRPW